MHFTTSRVVRFLAALLLLISTTGSLVFTRNQIRFQRFLSTHYIALDDFPPAYADTLRAKDWDHLESGQFDYARYFPSTYELESTNKIPPFIHFIW